MKYIDIFSFISGAILAYVVMPTTLHLLSQNSSTLELNYRNYRIPICMGLGFIFVQIINMGLVIILMRDNISYIIYYLFALVSMGLAGLLDDLIGDDSTKGLRGHIKSLLLGDLTTGGIKAGIGFMVAMLISIIISNTIMEIIVNILVMALFTNLINLFDLRPGRANKIFILTSAIMLYTSIIKHFNFLLFSFYGILITYLPIDLKEKAMMGDVGSNVLGITLGVFCILTHSLRIRAIYLSILIIIHIVSERVSFSEIIENNRLLKFIDNIGR
ncbi:MAG: phospho-N-acetylmuramoyl-pentapeptide-transferase [Tissierellia bacterium]|nr:phospho-N-acetylmuramoyl-pentapeptide-transferase [Tissierellia bacterium]